MLSRFRGRIAERTVGGCRGAKDTEDLLENSRFDSIFPGQPPREMDFRRKNVTPNKFGNTKVGPMKRRAEGIKRRH